jgi:glycosyltransferase involved in cell wall biosynthesis
MKPHFSIITPSFNRASRLRRTIQSIQAQGDEHIDHFVLDDGSNDETQNVFSEFEGTPRLHLHRFHQNQGANAARNFLLERILERRSPSSSQSSTTTTPT